MEENASKEEGFRRGGREGGRGRLEREGAEEGERFVTPLCCRASGREGMHKQRIDPAPLTRALQTSPFLSHLAKKELTKRPLRYYGTLNVNYIRRQIYRIRCIFRRGAG